MGCREVGVQEFGRFYKAEGSVFIDGSCMSPSSRLLARAGSAVVQMSDGAVAKSVVAHLPRGFQQSAAQAEHYGHLLASLCSEPGVQAVVDCGSVHTASVRGPRFNQQPSRSYGGLWKLNVNPLETRKTKAHRTLEQARADGDEADFHGNAAADTAAKQAVANTMPPEIVLSPLRGRVCFILDFYMAVGRVLASYPPSKQMWGSPQRARGRPRSAAKHQAGRLVATPSLGSLASADGSAWSADV